MSNYDVIVVGRGLIGSAAARHLAERGAHVALIGPGEPKDHRTHTGVFGSHYDSGRIVRILDPNPYFAHLAIASINRFRKVEAKTGIDFYHEVGYLAVSNNQTYLEQMEACANIHYPHAERLTQPDLANRFPYFTFPHDVRALYQATHGGYLNPRQHIAAQNKALTMQSGTVIEETVLEIDSSNGEVRARTKQEWVTGKKLLLATGIYANVGDIIPRKITFEVEPHTTVLGEISAEQLPELANMPSLSYRLGNEATRYIYFMPPIQYPDGKFYIKIGHSKGDRISNDEQSLRSWFQTDGDPQRVEWLTETLQNLLPTVNFVSLHSRSCALTISPTGKQFIDQFGDVPIYALLADHGQCAKSADELGLMATEFLTCGRLPAPYDIAEYKIQYA